MNTDLTHGTSSLKELVGVAVLQTDFPSAGRSTGVGHFPTTPEASMGPSWTARPSPHFVPFRLPVDVWGAGCVASPFSRVFFAYRIRSLHSTFCIAYR